MGLPPRSSDLAGPCTVTEIRTVERDGYIALQLGFGTNLERRFSKPVLGQFKKRNLPPARRLAEFRVADVAGLEPGQALTVAMFEKNPGLAQMRLLQAIEGGKATVVIGADTAIAKLGK